PSHAIKIGRDAGRLLAERSLLGDVCDAVYGIMVLPDKIALVECNLLRSQCAMTKVIVDPATLGKLHNLDVPLEVCDSAGRTLGYFHPLPESNAPSGSPFSRAELEQRRQQRTGRPLQEILDRLEGS